MRPLRPFVLAVLFWPLTLHSARALLRGGTNASAVEEVYAKLEAEEVADQDYAKLELAGRRQLTADCGTYYDYSAFTCDDGCSTNNNGVPYWGGSNSGGAGRTYWYCHRKLKNQNWVVIDMQTVRPVGGFDLQPSYSTNSVHANMNGPNGVGWLFCWSETALSGTATWPDCMRVYSTDWSGAYQSVDIPTDRYPGFVNARYLRFWTDSLWTAASGWSGPSIRDLSVRHGCEIPGWTLQPSAAPTSSPTTTAWLLDDVWWDSMNLVDYGQEWQLHRNALKDVYDHYGLVSEQGSSGLFMAYHGSPPSEGPHTFGDYIALGYEPLRKSDCELLSSGYPNPTVWMGSNSPTVYPYRTLGLWNTHGTVKYEYYKRWTTQHTATYTRHSGLPPGCTTYVGNGGGGWNNFWGADPVAYFPTVAECATNTDPNSVCTAYDHECWAYSCMFYFNPPPPPPPPTPSPTTCDYGQLITDAVYDPAVLHDGGSGGSVAGMLDSGNVIVGTPDTYWEVYSADSHHWTTPTSTSTNRWDREVVFDLGNNYDITHVMIQPGRIAGALGYDMPRWISVAGWNSPLDHTPPASFGDVMQYGGTFVWDDTIPGDLGHGAIHVSQAYATTCANPAHSGIPNLLDTAWDPWTGTRAFYSGGSGSSGYDGGGQPKGYGANTVFGSTDKKWTGVLPFKLKTPTLARYIAIKLNPCSQGHSARSAGIDYFGLVGSPCPIDGTRDPTPAPSVAPTTAVPSAAPTLAPTRVPASVSVDAPFYAFMGCESCAACDSTGFATQIEEILLTMVSDAVVCRVSASLGGDGTDVSYSTNDNTKTLSDHVQAFVGTGFVVTAAGAGGMTLSPTQPPSSSPTTAAPSRAPTPWPSAAPSLAPTAFPTESPTGQPTRSPSDAPSPSPSASPSSAPSSEPTASPTSFPSKAPTPSPTADPTASPTSFPSKAPSAAPTADPTASPTSYPSKEPTSAPSAAPTTSPTMPILITAEFTTPVAKDNTTVPEKVTGTAGATTDPICSETGVTCEVETRLRQLETGNIKFTYTVPAGSSADHVNSVARRGLLLALQERSRALRAEKAAIDNGEEPRRRRLAVGDVKFTYTVPVGTDLAAVNAITGGAQGLDGFSYVEEKTVEEIQADFQALADAGLAVVVESFALELDEHTGENTDDTLNALVVAVSIVQDVSTMATLDVKSVVGGVETSVEMDDPATKARYNSTWMTCAELEAEGEEACQNGGLVPPYASFTLLLVPCNVITCAPTATPTSSPSASPTSEPTASPTAYPSAAPSVSPSAEPTASPTAYPTTLPSASPSQDPTVSPTHFPSVSPTVYPTKAPTFSPTKAPTPNPTKYPTLNPTDSPTVPPTISYENQCCRCMYETTTSPSHAPTATPTVRVYTHAEMIAEINIRGMQDRADAASSKLARRGETRNYLARWRGAYYNRSDVRAGADVTAESESITNVADFIEGRKNAGVNATVIKELKQELGRQFKKQRVQPDLRLIKRTFSSIEPEKMDAVMVGDQCTDPAVLVRSDIIWSMLGGWFKFTGENEVYYTDTSSAGVNGADSDSMAVTMYASCESVANGHVGECLLDENNTVCELSLPDPAVPIRFRLYWFGTGGAGSEDGTDTDAPTPSPTTDNQYYYEQRQGIDALYGTHYEIHDSGVCSDNTQCDALSSFAAATCAEFAGRYIPSNGNPDIDLQGLTGAASNGAYPFGCSVTANEVVFNDNHQSGLNCSAESQCLCHCTSQTDAPSRAPTVAGVVVECFARPITVADSSVIPLDIVTLDYNRTERTVQILPFPHWDSDIYWHNDATGFDFGQTTSAWSTFTPWQQDAVNSLADHADCRFDYTPTTPVVALAEDCMTAYAISDDATRFEFLAATTVCYTNLTVDTCSNDTSFSIGVDGTWQSEAYTHPHHWEASYEALTGDHTSQCRRHWQLINFTVSQGGSISAEPESSLEAVGANFNKGDVVTLSAITWQRHDDVGAIAVPASAFTLVDNTDLRSLFLGEQYTFAWGMNDRTFGSDDRKYSDAVREQYSTASLTATWQRLNLATLEWVDIEDRYAVVGLSGDSYYDTGLNTTAAEEVVLSWTNTLDSTIIDSALTMNVTHFVVKSTINTRTNVFVEDRVRLRAAINWGTTNRRRLAHMCCDAFTAECLACSHGITVERFCEATQAAIAGCPVIVAKEWVVSARAADADDDAASSRDVFITMIVISGAGFVAGLVYIAVRRCGRGHEGYSLVDHNH